MTLRRRALAVVVALTAASSLASCGKGEKANREALAALHRTEHVARKFVYVDQTAKQRVSVQGAVEDDFRYKTLVQVNGTPAVEEVAADDALAVRFLEPTLIGSFLSPAGLAAASSGALPPAVGGGTNTGPSVLQLLGARRWVVDQSAAPSLNPTAKDFTRVGDNPVFDSLTAFQYIEQAINEAGFVVKYNKESLGYKPLEDPFRDYPPAKGDVRYDLVQRPLPRQGDQAQGQAANQAVPDAGHFRKMAIYVHNGLVVEVRERISVLDRLRDVQRVYSGLPKDKTPAELATVALDAINSVRKGQGLDPIRIRSMHLQVIDPRSSQTVALPADAQPGNLAALIGRPASTTGGAGGAGGSGDAGGGAAPAPGDQREPATTTTSGPAGG